MSERLARGDSPARVPDRLAIAGLFAFTLLLFAPALDPNRVFFERDIADYWYPQVESFVRAVAEGSWPLWNPYFTFGLPMWEDPAYQIAYPATWLNLVLRPATYYKFFVLSHCFFTSVGMYLLARRLKLSSLPAFLAAAAWSASGPFLSTVNLFHHFAGASWMPWVLLALHRALHMRTVGARLVLGAAVALQIVAGSGDVVVMTALLCGGLTALFLAEGEARQRLAVAARTVMVAFPFTVVLSAVQWLPAVGFVGEGRRLDLGTATLYWSVHPATLIDLFVSGLAAELSWNAAAKSRLFEGREPFIASFYLGVISISLVLLSWGSRSVAARRTAVALFVLFIVLALGRFAPGVAFLLHLPPFSILRYPVKYLIGAALAWALLVGVGMEAWLAEWSAREKRLGVIAACILLLLAGAASFGAWELWRGAARSLLREGAILGSESLGTFRLLGAGALAGGAALLLLFRCRGSLPAGWATATLGVALLSDLGFASRNINSMAPAELLLSRPPLLEPLGPRHDHVRLLVRIGKPTDKLGESITVARGWPFIWRLAQGYQEILPAPMGARWRLDGSFDGNMTGLTPRNIERLSWMATSTYDPRLALRMLQLGAVEYLVTLGRPIAQGLVEVGHIASVFTTPIRLFRVPDSLPRTYVVGSARALDQESAFTRIASADFDPRHEVLLDAGVRVAPAAPAFAGSSRIVERSFNEVVMDVDTNAEGYVVLVETYSRGWTAVVDGRPAEVLRANTAFRAVRVPPGHHRVTLAYRPRAVFYGCGITAAGILFGIGFWEWQRRRQAKESAS